MTRTQVKQLSLQIDRANRRLRERLSGLTDDEYLWEPVAGCWSVRRREMATSARPMGSGVWVFDYSEEKPSPPPFTTIAWRLMHLTDVFGAYLDALWGRGEVTEDWLEVAPTAAEGVALWERHAGAFALALAGEDDEVLARSVRVRWWPEPSPRWVVVAHVVTEAIHHGAEIGVLRDLYLYRAAWRP
jgi:uncharacterized damage-inducible protein DinB